jgi:hypothetical protein
MENTMKPYLKVSMLIAFALAIWVVGFSPPVHAMPMLRLTSGPYVVTVIDGGVGDGSPDPGIVSFTGAVGPFLSNATVGLTEPVVGTVNKPQVFLSSLDVSQPDGGTLTIEFTETDFLTLGPHGFVANIGGTTDGTTRYTTYRDPGNGAFAKSELLTALGPFTPLTFDGTTGTSVAGAASPYSLTLVVEISHPSGQHATSFGAELSAQPEPGTMVLFGTGLIGMFGYGWHRRKQII